MLGRRAGPGVEIEPWIEGRELIGTAGLHDPIAAANGPGTAADTIAHLKDGHAITGALKLVGGNQTGDTCAQDHHRATAPAGGRKREILGACRSWDRKPKRLHRHVGSAQPPCSSDLLEQCAAR